VVGGWPLARADIGSANLKAVHFTVGPVNQATEVMIDSPDVMGVVRVPVADGRPIDAKFARIYWSGKGPISARIPMSARTGPSWMPFPGSPSAAWIAASASCPWVR
jgi:hypothetical protein